MPRPGNSGSVYFVYAGHLDVGHPLHWTVDGVLTTDECRSLIERIEALNPHRATIDALGGPVLDDSLRNNDRVTFDDHALAAMLYPRLRPHLPEQLQGMTLLALNERFRGYRYHPDQVFKPHYDGSFAGAPRSGAC